MEEGGRWADLGVCYSRKKGGGRGEEAIKILSHVFMCPDINDSSSLSSSAIRKKTLKAQQKRFKGEKEELQLAKRWGQDPEQKKMLFSLEKKMRKGKKSLRCKARER